jgi:3',5'-cyclic AMP phosphodiesterase CpdA
VNQTSVERVFVLAHLSDPHLGPLPHPSWRELASKRCLGYVNWRRGRGAIHRAQALDAITDDLRRERADHVAVTGDLVNIALQSEFERARKWLESLGPPADVSLVPGNHDAYVRAAAVHRDRHWAPYMEGDPFPGKAAAGFPYVRRRGRVALVGLSTAVVTPAFMATGRLGGPQIERAGEILAELGAAGLFRVVMIHHPPGTAASWPHKRLTDAAAFRRMIAAAGAELLIHGHDHVHALGWLAGKGARVPAIGVPSASAWPPSNPPPLAGEGWEGVAAAYNLYRIGGSAGAFTCEVVSRSLRPNAAVAEISRYALSWSDGKRAAPDLT